MSQLKIDQYRPNLTTWLVGTSIFDESVFTINAHSQRLSRPERFALGGKPVIFGFFLLSQLQCLIPLGYKAIYLCVLLKISH